MRRIPTFVAGDRVRLNCPTARAYNGRLCSVVRPLVIGAEVDAEVGPMFRVFVDDLGSFDAFIDEMEPAP